MYVVVIDGVGARPVAEQLAEAMETKGPTAIVQMSATPVAASAVSRINIDPSGGWKGQSGRASSLQAQLELLAPKHRYAIVVTAEDTSWPTVVAGEDRVHGDLISEPTPRSELPIEEMIERLEETEPYVTLESLVQEVKNSDNSPHAGAISTFTGRVRMKESSDDVATEYLEFETYTGVAAEKMAAIERELLEREGVFEVRMHHRTGVIQAEEDIVFVVVLAGHRDEAFRTVEDGINRLKAEVPIFKKEVTVTEEFWVHTRP